MLEYKITFKLEIHIYMYSAFNNSCEIKYASISRENKSPIGMLDHCDVHFTSKYLSNSS